jgi:WD40 repeat protein
LIAKTLSDVLKSALFRLKSERRKHMVATLRILNFERLSQMDDCVETIAISPLDGRMAVGSLSGETWTIDDEGKVVLPHTHDFGVGALAWSPISPTLVSGGLDGLVRLLGDDGTCIQTFLGKGWVSAIRWRLDGREFSAAIGKQVIRVSVSDDGNAVETARHSLDSTATCLAYTSNGQRLGVGSYGGISWFEEADEMVRHFPWKGAPLAISISPNGKWVATGNQDASVHCWKLWAADDLQMSGYETKIQHLEWDLTSRYLAVGSIADISLWDFSGRGPKGSTPIQLVGHARHLVALKYQPNSSILMSAGAEGTVCLWNPASGKKSLVANANIGEEPTCATWSKDGKSVFVGTALGGIFKVDVSEF